MKELLDILTFWMFQPLFWRNATNCDVSYGTLPCQFTNASREQRRVLPYHQPRFVSRVSRPKRYRFPAHRLHPATNARIYLYIVMFSCSTVFPRSRYLRVLHPRRLCGNPLARVMGQHRRRRWRDNVVIASEGAYASAKEVGPVGGA